MSMQSEICTMYKYSDECNCKCEYIHTYMHAYIHTYAYPYIHTYTYTYMCLYISICMIVYVYIHEYTQIQTSVKEIYASSIHMNKNASTY